MGFAFWQRYCTVLQQWASAKLCGVEQTAPPIFGRVAITLGIGPHSSFVCNLVLSIRLWNGKVYEHEIGIKPFELRNYFDTA